MITCLKQGRMGNVFFIYAATIALAEKNKDQYRLPSWDQQKFIHLPENYYQDNLPYQQEYLEPHFHFAPIPYQSNLRLNGYFQSYKYWLEIEDQIKHFFTPKICDNLSVLKNTAAIHIRRGDYVNLTANHPILPMSFYQEAQEVIKAKKYLIVSDDIVWCKENFQGSQYLFSETNVPHLDLALMTKCEAGVIVANSSFSWWGAYLNTISTKVIVAPKQWFGLALAHHDTKDLIPSTWIKI